MTVRACKATHESFKEHRRQFADKEGGTYRETQDPRLRPLNSSRCR
ncbi:hypothetical protein ACCJ77_004333 [Escherichia coli]